MSKQKLGPLTWCDDFCMGVIGMKYWTLTTVLLGLSGCGGSSGPPAVPSAPPATVSAPPPTAPVAREPGAQAAVSKPAAKPSRSKTTDEGPTEQLFDQHADTQNFTVDYDTPQSQLYYVSASSLDGSVVTVEQPPVDVSAVARSVPAGFQPVLSAGHTETGWPRRIRGEIDGKEMACVPGGLFTQGVDGGPADAAPSHPISLDTYYIDVTEVTMGEFAKFKAALLGKDGGPANSVPLNGDPRTPVTKVSWKDAQNYAKWAGKELPTEAEWEKAGRGPDAGAFPWGDDRVLWHQPRIIGQVDMVGSYPHDRSRYGVLDLSGNVREWCSDFYHNAAYAEAKNKDGSPAHNWPGPRKASNGERVVKGGVDRWELWSRGSHSMTKPAADIGFRCVLRCGADSPKE